MPEALKHLYSKEYIELLAKEIEREFPVFHKHPFTAMVLDNQWPKLELKQRMRRISECLRAHLPQDFTVAVKILIKVRPRMNGLKYINFANVCFADFVECYGLEHYTAAIPALEFFTIDSSSEFAVRPFIIRYPKAMMKQMLVWAHHPNEHVRRLASEGCRPRLPWAMGLPEFRKDPSPILPILEKLKDDPSEFVRRSVANNLNDIAKDHPDLVLKLAKKWSGHSDATDRLIRHGCRTLLKRGHERTLNHFGLRKTPGVKVTGFKFSKSSVAVGDTLSFSFRVFTPVTQKLRIEYKIGFLTSRGVYSYKIFKIGEKIFEKQIHHPLSRSHSFRDRTIRKHYSGKHTLSILINGTVFAQKSFQVIKGSRS